MYLPTSSYKLLVYIRTDLRGYVANTIHGYSLDT